MQAQASGLPALTCKRFLKSILYNQGTFVSNIRRWDLHTQTKMLTLPQQQSPAIHEYCRNFASSASVLQWLCYMTNHQKIHSFLDYRYCDSSSSALVLTRKPGYTPV